MRYLPILLRAAGFACCGWFVRNRLPGCGFGEPRECNRSRLSGPCPWQGSGSLTVI